MKVLIAYDSQFGNTERIARVIARRMGSARLLRVEEVDVHELISYDLLIAAAPTQRQRISPAMRVWLERLPYHSLEEVSAGAFDTRYRMPRLLTGSAAERITSHLKKAGARLIVPPESFFIQRDIPPAGEKRRHEMEQLESGEEERAREWAIRVLEHVGIKR